MKSVIEQGRKMAISKWIKVAVLAMLILITSAIPSELAAQAKVAYIDSEYILDQMPEYKSAQKQLDETAKMWKDELEEKTKELDRLTKELRAQSALLPATEREKKEKDLQVKADELAKYRKEKFGPEGELFKKRQELIRPIQDRIFEAVQNLAKDAGLDIIFDKAGAATMIYSSAKYDRSDDILVKLGIAKK